MTLLPKVGLGCLLLGLFLAPLMGGSPAGVVYKYDDILGAIRLLVLVGALLTPLRPASGKLGTPARGAAGLAALWTVLSLLVHSKFLTSPTLLFAMLPATTDWVCFAALLAVMGGLEEKERSWAISAILASGGFAAILTLQDSFSAAEPGYRTQGPFFSPNFAAGFLGLCVPLALERVRLAEKNGPRIAWGVLVVALLGAVAATGSRSALVIVAVGAGVSVGLSALQKRPGFLRPLATLGAGLIVAALMGFALGPKPLAARAAGAGQEQSNEFRKWTWKGTLNMAKESPILGEGPGTFPYLYPKHALVGKTDLAHSSYLQLAAEQGFPALLFALGALGLALLAGLKSQPALVGAVLIGGARSLFDSEWSILGDALPFWAIAGMLSSYVTAPQPPAPASGYPGERPSSGSSIIGGQGVIVALLAPFALLALPPIRMSWPPPTAPHPVPTTTQFDAALAIEPSVRLAFPAGRRAKSPAETIRYFEIGHRADPTNFQLLRALAETYEASGDKQRATATWRELVAKAEGPIGTIRAIAETTDTYPAYAYEALGEHEKTAQIVERYAKTSVVYQKLEFTQVSAETVLQRREDLKVLYNKALDGLGLSPTDSRRTETISRLDGMVKP